MSSFRSALAASAVALLIVGCVSVGVPPTGSPLASASALPTAELPSASFPVATASLGIPTLGPATDAPATATLPTPTPTGTPTAPPTPRPARITAVDAPRTVDCNVDPQPSTVHLEWTIRRATGVELSIDGPGVYDTYEGESGSADVPFACSEPEHTYTLRTIGGDGEADRQRVVIRRAEPVVKSFSAATLVLNGTTCQQVYDRRFFWEVDHATGVTIEIEGQVHGSYSGRTGDVLLPYDCQSSDTVTYKLTTDAPYGPQASMEIEVGYVYEP